MKKNLILFTVVLLLCNIVNAQNFTISGTLPKNVTGNIQLVLDRTYLGKSPETITTQIINGHFELKAKLDRNCFVELNNHSMRLPLYAEPGFELTLNIPEGATSLANTLSGKGAAENNFIQLFYNQFGTD